MSIAMMKAACTLLVAMLVAGCYGGEVQVAAPRGPSIAIVDADYVVLRPVASTPGPGSVAAIVNGQTVYYQPTARIMDLRHFDPRTAEVHESRAGTYAVAMRTTPEGDRLLGEWTAANLEQQLGIFVDGKLVSAPYIKSKIIDMIIIQHEFTQAEAETIVARLRRGGATER